MHQRNFLVGDNVKAPDGMQSQQAFQEMNAAFAIMNRLYKWCCTGRKASYLCDQIKLLARIVALIYEASTIACLIIHARQAKTTTG